MKTIQSFFLCFGLALALSSCDLFGKTEIQQENTAELVLTSAMQTVAAELDKTPTAPQITPSPSSTVSSALTSESASGSESIGTPARADASCDQGLFIEDVNVPDGQVFAPGEPFSKTWRIQNYGTCTWTTAYEVLFFEGDQMSAPYSRQLSSTPVLPGEVLDITVDMRAPLNPGTYRGYWILKNARGEQFTLTNDQAFWVEIEVVPSTATPGPRIETLTLTAEQVGEVQSDGMVYPHAYVGDTENNLALQAFFAFDISPLPEDAIIDRVVVSFVNFDTLGEPFTALGCLRAYSGSFFPLSGNDYQNTTGASISWCSKQELEAALEDDDVLKDLQAAVGQNFLEYRLQFNELETNHNGADDLVRFGTVSLMITYQTTP